MGERKCEERYGQRQQWIMFYRSWLGICFHLLLFPTHQSSPRSYKVKGERTSLMRWSRPCPNRQTLFFFWKHVKVTVRSPACESCCWNPVKSGAYVAMVNCTTQRERERERERMCAEYNDKASTNSPCSQRKQQAKEGWLTHSCNALRRSTPEMGH